MNSSFFAMPALARRTREDERRRPLRDRRRRGECCLDGPRASASSWELASLSLSSWVGKRAAELAGVGSSFIAPAASDEEGLSGRVCLDWAAHVTLAKAG